MPEYNEDGSEKTVQDMVAENAVATAPSFSQVAEAVADPDHDAEYGSRYAVEGNDLSHFVGVSEEYRTYASEVDSPLDYDPEEADATVVANAEETQGDEAEVAEAQRSAGQKPAAKKATATPPIPTSTS